MNHLYESSYSRSTGATEASSSLGSSASSSISLGVDTVRCSPVSLLCCGGRWGLGGVGNGVRVMGGLGSRGGLGYWGYEENAMSLLYCGVGGVIGMYMELIPCKRDMYRKSFELGR